MPALNTFTLRPPQSKPIEVVIVTLADGSTVARTAAELAAADAAAPPK
jgi:hypothetical protein